MKSRGAGEAKTGRQEWGDRERCRFSLARYAGRGEFQFTGGNQTDASMVPLKDKFRGCLLGAAIGDVVGAVVEAESPQYIARTYRSIDDILSVETVPEFTGPPWRVGRYTDDTQMMTMQFPHGSHGNGSAMRVAPVGLAYFHDMKRAASVAMESSRPTHSHPLAYQGAVLQCVSVASAVNSVDPSPAAFLEPLRERLAWFADLQWDTSSFADALDVIEAGLAQGSSCAEMSAVLGTGITAHESVPIALYCFLRHPHSFAEVIYEAVFAGGDTDTIACMAGAISGAFLGFSTIPGRWLTAIREEVYSARAIEALADRMWDRYASDQGAP